MTPLCDFCGRRYFVVGLLEDGSIRFFATCRVGAAYDRRISGQDHSTAGQLEEAVHGCR